MDPRRHLGALGERLAAEHLERRGYAIVARNYRTRWGELDLVAFDARADALVFVEVKTRRAGPGATWDSLHALKQQRVRNMAKQWLAEVRERPRAVELRFDAIGVRIDAAGRLAGLDHLEAAF